MSDKAAAIYWVTDPRFNEHQAPWGHPESPRRLEAVARGAEAANRRGVPLVELDVEPAADAVLLRGHSPGHLKAVAEASSRGRHLDGDTYTSPRSDAVARLAVGSCAELCRAVLRADGPRRGFAAVRPPGHHATAAAAMGFCLYSNAALAALDVVESGLAERVAIVDWDVHHGNGTEDILWEDPRVLYLSIHQWPLYPGTGRLADLGAGDGLGKTLNLPLPSGSGDGDYLAALQRIALPVLTHFDPQLVIVSAGFDAHRLDPLAGMRLSSAAYGAMTEALCELGRPTVFLLEGGYHPDGLARGVRQTLLAASGIPSADAREMWAQPAAPRPVVERRLEEALTRFAAHWPGLAEASSGRGDAGPDS